MKTIRKIVKKLNIKGVQSRLVGVCSKSRFLSSVYYLFFSSAFSREHQKVLAGKARHLRELKMAGANYYQLVRNTHRIEKGLLMKPRKDVFATAYIRETVDSFSRIWRNEDPRAEAQRKWFKDVMSEYFQVVAETPLIREQKQRFKTLVNGEERDPASDRSIPYKRRDAHSAGISFEQFYRLTRQRRSVRWFLSKAVPRELIDQAIRAAIQAPSACNRQPFEFRIFDDPGLVRKVSAFPMGTQGYGTSIPVFVVVVGNLDAYFSERDRHLIYIDGALASMNFMLALETLGLGSCPINWPDIEERERKMQEFLGLNEWQRPVMCIGLGYPDPDGLIAYSEKRGLDQIRTYNFTT